MSRGITKNYFAVFDFLKSKGDYATIEEVASGININRSSVHRALVRLVKFKVVSVLPTDRYRYKIEPNYLDTDYGSLLEKSRPFSS